MGAKISDFSGYAKFSTLKCKLFTFFARKSDKTDYDCIYREIKRRILRSVERIESQNTDVLRKSFEASRVLGEAFDSLKQYIIAYHFQNDDEEIKFFKEIKACLFCRLIYYRKLYNIEMTRPVGNMEAQREYQGAMFGASTRTRRNASACGNEKTCLLLKKVDS